MRPHASLSARNEDREMRWGRKRSTSSPPHEGGWNQTKSAPPTKPMESNGVIHRITSTRGASPVDGGSDSSNPIRPYQIRIRILISSYFVMCHLTCNLFDQINRIHSWINLTFLKLQDSRKRFILILNLAYIYIYILTRDKF